MHKQSLRWFQVSLRSLFMLTLLVATWLAGYMAAMRKAEQALQAEREAAERAARAPLLEEQRLAERDGKAAAAALAWLKRAQISGNSWNLPDPSTSNGAK